MSKNKTLLDEFSDLHEKTKRIQEEFARKCDLLVGSYVRSEDSLKVYKIKKFDFVVKYEWNLTSIELSVILVDEEKFFLREKKIPVGMFVNLINDKKLKLVTIQDTKSDKDIIL